MNVERRARNEALFREVNERIFDLSRLEQTAEFLCECGASDCMQTVRLDVSVYEGVRSFEFRFLVLPGHVDPETEVVRAEAETYVVVEKIGAAAQAVEETVSDLRDGA